MGCSAEITAQGGYGAEIDLDAVNVAVEGMAPEVLAVGETQERLLWVVPPGFAAEILRIYNEEFTLPDVAYNARATVVGRAAHRHRFRAAAERGAGRACLRFLSLRLITDLLREPRWLTGIACMIGGQVLAAWSIGNLSLGFVEPLLTTNLVFALILAVPITKASLRFWEVFGAVVLCTGVALLSASRSAKPIGLSFGSVTHGRPPR